MTATYNEAKDQILALFKTAWDTTGYGVVYPNKEGDKPNDAVPWARVDIEHFDGGDASLSGVDGTKRYERDGVFTAQIFVPSGEGLSEAYTLANTVSTAFEGKTTAGGVWFRDVRIREVGPTESWFQLNVKATFNYDEVK